MKVVYARQEFPENFASSIFLAGPSPRNEETPSWRPAFIEELRKQGYDGVVFSPESDPQYPRQFDYDTQVEWEQKGRNLADIIAFWVPRQIPKMPALVTNIEYGQDLASGKVVYGRPAWAEKCRYLDKLAVQNSLNVFDSITAQVHSILSHLGVGAHRKDGERYIPLDIWRTKQFQAWYRSQISSSNRLDGAKLLWNFRVGKNRTVLAYALWVKIWIEAEQRYKENEFILSRPDISVIVPVWHADDPLDSKVVLIREFRSSVRNSDGFVHEFPSGSSSKPQDDRLVVAAHELEEETSLKLEPRRFKFLGSRQLAATFSTHCADMFRVDLSFDEISAMEALADTGKSFGVASETERTYLEVKTVRDIYSETLLDWTMLGILSQALVK